MCKWTHWQRLKKLLQNINGSYFRVVRSWLILFSSLYTFVFSSFKDQNYSFITIVQQQSVTLVEKRFEIATLPHSNPFGIGHLAPLLPPEVPSVFSGGDSRRGQLLFWAETEALSKPSPGLSLSFYSQVPLLHPILVLSLSLSLSFSLSLTHTHTHTHTRFIYKQLKQNLSEMEQIIWKYRKRKISIYITCCEGKPLVLHCAKYFTCIAHLISSKSL